MKTVAVLSQKGGAGKTTIAIHLAVASVAAGRPASIIDLDPQSSASSWKDLRESAAPAVIVAQPARLQAALSAARAAGSVLTFVDTAPHAEGAALAAARAADLILIPCRPSILDLKAIAATVDLARIAGRPAAIVLNAVPPRGARLGDDAETAVETYGLPIAPVRLTQRASYVHCLTTGQTAQEYEPEGKAADEITQLYTWTCTQVDLTTRRSVKT